MREYSANYALFGKGGDFPLHYRNEACYASLFNEYRVHQEFKGAEQLKAYYWLEEQTKTEDADWFVESFVIPSMPTRMQKHVSFEVIPDDRKNISGIKDTDRYWKTMTLDPRSVCAFDALALLTLVRYAQEQPLFVGTFRKLADSKEYKTLDEAFLFAHLDGTNRSGGHTFFSYSFYYTWEADKNIKFPKFTVSKRWTSAGKGAKPLCKTQKRPQLNTVFDPTRKVE